MKTTTVSAIIKSAASRAGMDGSNISALPTATKTIMLDNLQMHLRDAWEWFDWPDLCRIEERTIQTGADDDLYIDLAQSGETAMGAVFNIYLDNPNTHVAPREVGYTLDVDKVRLPPDTEETVHVRFRLEPTELSTDLTTALAETVPAVLADAIKFNLTGDLLQEDGQLDKAEVHYARAQNALIGEMDKIIFQQNQPRRWTAAINT
jgi:hypothetical protein